ncbi:hypothetical protein KW790_03500 [Candidatus Parcubacteria bacterium]|nr:hypothetical protein [Candidatus Parcubacteria bacterium]
MPIYLFAPSFNPRGGVQGPCLEFVAVDDYTALSAATSRLDEKDSGTVFRMVSRVEALPPGIMEKKRKIQDQIAHAPNCYTRYGLTLILDQPGEMTLKAFEHLLSCRNCAHVFESMGGVLPLPGQS